MLKSMLVAAVFMFAVTGANANGWHGGRVIERYRPVIVCRWPGRLVLNAFGRYECVYPRWHW